MKTTNLSLIIVLVLALFLVSAASAVGKENYPTRAVTIIDPWQPGGGHQLGFQAMHSTFEKSMGVGAAVVNKPGGGGTIAWNYVANSSPDGYTVGVVNPSLIVTRYTTKTGVSNDKYDPVIRTVILPAGVAVRTDSPWKNFKEFIAYAKANPGKVQMANSGYAAMYHIGTVGIEQAMGVKFTHIPFKGTPPSITAMLGGHVDGTLTTISTIFPYVEAKKFRVLAVSSSTRLGVLPDVPTFAEYGFDLDVATWYAYVVPNGTPRDRINMLHKSFKVGIDSEEFREYNKRVGGIIAYLPPEELGEFLNKQDKLWKKIIDYGGFKQGD